LRFLCSILVFLSLAVAACSGKGTTSVDASADTDSGSETGTDTGSEMDGGADANTDTETCTADAGERLGWVAKAGVDLGGAEMGYALCLSQSGSVLVTGSIGFGATFGWGNPTQTILGEHDRFVYARYSSTGTFQEVVESDGIVIGNGIAVSSDDAVCIVGDVYEEVVLGEGEPNETTLGDADCTMTLMFLAEYEPDGSLSWAKQIGDCWNRAIGSASVALSDGSVVVTGRIYSGQVVFGEGEPNETSLDTNTGTLFLAKFAADGELAWVKQPTGGGEGLSLSRYPDDTFVLTGILYGHMTLGLGEPNETILDNPNSAYRDVFLAKYDGDGRLIWARRDGGELHENAYSVTVMPDGGAAITGDYTGIAIFGAGEPNETQLPPSHGFFVARYAADGRLVWVRSAHEGTTASGFGVAAMPDGAIAVSGWFAEDVLILGEGEPNETWLSLSGVPGDDTDAFVAKWNEDGTLAWALKAGGPDTWISESFFPFTGGDIAKAVAVSPAGDALYVTGTFVGKAVFGRCEPNETVLTAYGSENYAFLDDLFLMRLTP
jgi:hypothetical protein